MTENLKQTISEAELVQTALPACPQLSLYLISEAYPRGPLPHEEMLAIMAQPAYWAFCWASGQVLAAELLKHPELCRDKTVLDLGAGSGVVAIAAALSGARRVIACDLDPQALDACRANAKLNAVELETLDDLEKLDSRVDLLIAADVLYDRENLVWLDQLARFAATVIIADSRIRDPQVFKGYDVLGTQTSCTLPDLDELKEFGKVSLYRRTFDR